jgi:small-conductance mechanosensitive channel
MNRENSYNLDERYKFFEIEFKEKMSDWKKLAFTDHKSSNIYDLDAKIFQPISEELKVLKQIEKEIENLTNKVKDIERNGRETLILSYNDERIKLFAKLDSIGGSSEEITDELRSRRRKSYTNLDELSKILYELALNNLDKLLKSLHYLKINDQEFQKISNDINLIKENKKKATIKELDDYRYALEEIKDSKFSKNRHNYPFSI